MEVRGEKQTFSFLVISPVFLLFFFPLFICLVRYLISLEAVLGVQKFQQSLVCYSGRSCATVTHTDLSFTADLKANGYSIKNDSFASLHLWFGLFTFI